MTTRENDPLMEMAERVSAVFRQYRERDITPENVDLRMVAELAWALGVDLELRFKRTEPRP